MIKKIRYISALASTAVLTLPALVAAQFTPTPAGANLPGGSIMNIIANIMTWLLGLVGFIGVIGFAIAGILYLTAAGDEDRISQAKRAMSYSIIGVIVAVVGVVILKAAQSMLGAQGQF